MTKIEFDNHGWGGTEWFTYKGKDYRLASVDFEEGLIGLLGVVTNGPEDVTWVRCENAEIALPTEAPEVPELRRRIGLNVDAIRKTSAEIAEAIDDNDMGFARSEGENLRSQTEGLISMLDEAGIQPGNMTDSRSEETASRPKPIATTEVPLLGWREVDGCFHGVLEQTRDITVFIIGPSDEMEGGFTLAGAFIPDAMDGFTLGSLNTAKRMAGRWVRLWWERQVGPLLKISES